MNIHLILQMAADSMPDREAVICGSQKMTYQALADAVNALADKLETPRNLPIWLRQVQQLRLPCLQQHAVPYVPGLRR